MKKVMAVLSLVAACSAVVAVAQDTIDSGGRPIKRVLLISVDGMHAVDLQNCVNGISTVNSGAPYCPTLAALGKTGVNYVAAILSNDDYFTNQLNSNPYNNPTVFRDILVHEGDTPKQTGYLSVIALVGPDDPNFGSQAFYFGVEDESAKLNINALLQYDKKGTVGAQMLQFLPNMTQEIANSIVDWVDSSSSTPRSGGAKDEYYPGLSPAYHVKKIEPGPDITPPVDPACKK